MQEVRTKAEGGRGVLPKLRDAGAGMPGEQKTPKKKVPLVNPFSNKVFRRVVLPAVVVLIVWLAASGLHKTTIDLNKYLTVTFHGCNGYGYAECVSDADAFAGDYEDVRIPDRHQTRELLEVTEEESGEEISTYGVDFDEACDMAMEEGVFSDLPGAFGESASYCVSIDNAGNLSNGDTVTAHWDEEQLTDPYFQDFLDIMGCRLSDSDLTVEVEGLKEVRTVDPFASLNVTFSGRDGQGKVSWSNEAADEMGKSLTFSVDSTCELSIGDTVTVSVENADISDLADRYGEIPEPTSKTCTIENLDHFVTSISEVTPTVLAAMQKKAQERITDRQDFNDNHAKKMRSVAGPHGSERGWSLSLIFCCKASIPQRCQKAKERMKTDAIISFSPSIFLPPG